MLKFNLKKEKKRKEGSFIYFAATSSASWPVVFMKSVLTNAAIKNTTEYRNRKFIPIASNKAPASTGEVIAAKAEKK